MEQAHQAADIPRAGDIAPSPWPFWPARTWPPISLSAMSSTASVRRASRSMTRTRPGSRAGGVPRSARSDERPTGVLPGRTAGNDHRARAPRRSDGRPISRTKRSRSSSSRTWSAFGDVGIILQPGERRHADRRIDSKQLVELGESASAETAVEQGIRGALAGPGAAGNGGALDHRRLPGE